MHPFKVSTLLRFAPFSLVAVLALTVAAPLRLRAQPPPPPAYSDLERLVDRIALYPDPLLSDILAASTYPEQIFDAEAWAHRHEYLRGGELARAISEDRLPFDPSVQALLPFPQVLDIMARDVEWTRALGNAFLANSASVMDAVQGLRHRAWDAGYLRSSPEVSVRNGPYIEIIPVRPDYVYVPVYDPRLVYYAPRPGIRVGISWGPGIVLGAGFAPWGWGTNRFAWDTHTVILNNRPWGRTMVNRGAYVHPYQTPRYERREDRREVHDRREGRREERH